MNEFDYWYNRANQDTNTNTLYTEAMLSYMDTKSTLALVESLKPLIIKDGSQWCVLYGENLQEGIAGFGSTPMEAINAFNNEFYKTAA